MNSCFTPHKNWPAGMFTPYHDDNFPDVAELQADLIEPQPMEITVKDKEDL